MISIGFVQPCFCRRVQSSVGISCREAVFITTNIAIELVAVDFELLFFCSFFMASIPKGVAALPSPSKFAVIFMHIAFAEGLSAGQSGKINFIIGENKFDKYSVILDFSAIFIIPVQKAIIPKMEIIKETASLAPDKTALESAEMFPVKNAHIVLNIIKKAQI